jgi:hypothetical protein
MGIDPLTQQRSKHPRTAVQRHFALSGLAAEEDGYFPEIIHDKTP